MVVVRLSRFVPPLGWVIPPLCLSKPRMSDRDKYGSRNYQIILHHMQLLPCTSYLNPPSIDTKGKRKAYEEPEDGDTGKKQNIVVDDWNMVA